MSTAAAEKPKEEVKIEPLKPESGAAQKFLTKLVGKDIAVEPPAAGTVTDDDPEKGKKVEDKKSTPAKVEKKAKKPAPVTPVVKQLTAAEIADASAAGATRVLAEHMEKRDKTPEEPKIEFSPQETRRLAVLEQMEKTKPEYKGTAQKYRDSLVNLLEYSEKWEKEHPGKEFNQDDDEHKEFIDKLQVDWDEDDYAEALADLRVEERIGATKKEMDEKFATIQKSERRNAETPKIRAAQVTNARSFYAQLGDEFKDLLNANGTVNNDVLTKLQAEEAVNTDLAIAGADLVETYSRATYELFNDLTDFDQKNPVHAFLNNFILAKEKMLTEQPVDDQLDSKGRQFLPAAEYHKKMQANAANTTRMYWTFEQADVDKLMGYEILKHTKTKIEQANALFERMARQRGIELPKKEAPKAGAKAEEKKVVPPKEEKTAEDEDNEDEVDNGGKPRSPSAKFGAPPAPGDKTATDDNAPTSRFAKKFLGR